MEFTKEVKDLGNSNVQLDVCIAKSDVKAAYDSTVKKYAKEAQIPGFRKGKVPASVLERRFGESLRMEAAYDLVEDVLKEVFDTDDKRIKPLNYAQPELLDKPELDPEQDLKFSVTYDVYPQAELKKTEGFTIKVPEVFGEDDALEEELKHIQFNNAFVIDRKEGESAQKGDIVTINYCELDESEKAIEGTNREDFTFEIGTGQNLYKLDDDIIGMKKDEEKIIRKEYPADADDKDIAGTTKNIKVKLTALKFRDLPAIDDELAKDVSEKYKTLDDLKADLKTKIGKAVSDSIKNTKVAAYLDALIEANDFVLPESMVQAELELHWASMARQMGISVEQLNAMMDKGDNSTKKNFFESSKPNSVKELKKQIIIQDFLEKMPEITAEDADFENRYAEIAENSNTTVEEVKKAYDNPNHKQYLTDTIKQDKLFDILLEKCTIEKGEKITATELLKRQGIYHE